MNFLLTTLLATSLFHDAPTTLVEEAVTNPTPTVAQRVKNTCKRPNGIYRHDRVSKKASLA